MNADLTECGLTGREGRENYAKNAKDFIRKFWVFLLRPSRNLRVLCVRLSASAV